MNIPLDFFQGYQIDILCLYWAPFLKQRSPIELLIVFYDSGPVCAAPRRDGEPPRRDKQAAVTSIAKKCTNIELCDVCALVQHFVITYTQSHPMLHSSAPLLSIRSGKNEIQTAAYL